MTRCKASTAYPSATTVLLEDIRPLINAASPRAALAVNSELTKLFRRASKRIRTEVLAGQRAS
jgi:hypothetical protein